MDYHGRICTGPRAAQEGPQDFFVCMGLCEYVIFQIADRAASVSAYVGLISAVQTLEQTHGKSKLYYRKRGSASYIVREVHSVRERERYTERERERKTEVTSPWSR